MQIVVAKKSDDETAIVTETPSGMWNLEFHFYIWSSTERKIGLLSDAMSTWLFDDFLLFDFSK